MYSFMASVFAIACRKRLKRKGDGKPESSHTPSPPKQGSLQRPACLLHRQVQRPVTGCGEGPMSGLWSPASFTSLWLPPVRCQPRIAARLESVL